MTEKDFNIILSKNRLAKTIRDLYEENNEPIPDYVRFDLNEIESKTGTANQPTVNDILDSEMDI